MSYSIPINLKVLPKEILCITDFLMNLKIKSNTMVFLSEGCYSWLKLNSTHLEQSTAKIFLQLDNSKSTKDFIEIINIDSSNCSLLKSVFSSRFHYEYTNGVPKEIILITLDNEETIDINVNIIEPEHNLSPVECIINNPDIFEEAIIFLNATSYERLKRNTNTISNVSHIERLIWNADIFYPGGSIVLHELNYGNLYCLNNMCFSFFTKNFAFKKLPTTIYFII